MPKPHPSFNTHGSTPEVPSNPDQQENLQEILSEFDKLGTSQHIDNYPNFSTTQEVVETVITQPPKCLHPTTNSLAAIANPYTTMTPSRSATTTIPSDLSIHTPLISDYDSNFSPSMLQQLRVKW